MDFSFDECMKLAIEDPEAFESYRLEVLKQVIDSARPEDRQRMQGLQFQIDMEIRKARTPMSSCLSLQRLMLDFVFNELELSIKRCVDKQKIAVDNITQGRNESAIVIPLFATDKLSVSGRSVY